MATLIWEGELSEGAKQAVQGFMDATADHHNAEVKALMDQQGLTFNCALDVSYLRTRSRWTKELEQRLIESHKAGRIVNICDWPYHEDRGE